MKNGVMLILAVLTVYLTSSCLKEEFVTSSDMKVEFSVDTLLFDTVFANVGSTTAYLTLRNPNDKGVKINSLCLAKGENSPFRVNINGEKKYCLENVELSAKDSLYILVEITVDPNDKNNPYVLEDSIVCRISQAVYDVKLRAWGQNVHYIDGRKNGLLQTQTWTADKPYLVYNSMSVDSLQTLTLEAGTHIYMHKDAHIFVKGNLIVNGTFEEPVVIEGDRLEEYYKDKAGQWGNIILAEGSQANYFKWAEIKNGTIGLQVGGLSNIAKSQVHLENCKIENMSYANLFCLSSEVTVNNSLFSNAAYYNLVVLAGGEYEFNYCTFANYWSNDVRSTPAVVLSNNIIQKNQKYQGDLKRADFTNCIISGDTEEELELSQDEGAEFNYFFSNCLIWRTEKTFTSEHSEHLILDQKPMFEDAYTGSFILRYGSPAIDQAKPLDSPFLMVDLNNQTRDVNQLPDIGAYEFVEPVEEE